jgi:hypothetical protein
MESNAHERTPDYISELQLAIQRHPLEALGLGFLAGFVVGGGHGSRIGQWMIGFAARLAVKQMTMAMVSEALRET